MSLKIPLIILGSLALYTSSMLAKVRTETFTAAPTGWHQHGIDLGFTASANAGEETGEAGGTLVSDLSSYGDTTVGPLSLDNVLSGSGTVVMTGTEGSCFIGHYRLKEDGTAEASIGITISIRNSGYWMIAPSLKTPKTGDLIDVTESEFPLTITVASGERLKFSYLYVPICNDGYARLFLWTDGMDHPEVARLEIKNPADIVFDSFGIAGYYLLPKSEGATASVYLDNLSYTVGDPSPYPAWWDAAMDRIDGYRKGNLKLKVKDENGKPVNGAKITVRQTSTPYGFGGAINETYLYDGKDTPDGRMYSVLARRLFNKTVLEGGQLWSNWEDPAYRIKTDYAVKWILDAGIKLRGHTMLWQQWDFLPADLKEHNTDSEYIDNRVMEHVTEIGTFYKNSITEWDVVDEQLQENALTSIIDGTGNQSPSLIRWYHAAAESVPGGQNYLNDFGILQNGQLDGKAQDYETQVQYLLSNAAPLSGIGFQAHYWDSSTRPTNDDLWNLFEKFATFKIDLQITEFDMYGGGWDNQTQAEWARELYTMAFSHPAFKGFMMWGFWDGKHWKNSAPLFQKDWVLKPSGESILDLACRKFRTNTSGLSDAEGNFQTRAYAGNYDVFITLPNGTEQKLSTIVSTPVQENPNPFDAVPIITTSGVKESFIGDMIDGSYPWVYAFNQGWWYLYGIDTQRFWAWDLTEGMEWLYLDASVWPWVYSFGHTSWMSYGGSEDDYRYYYQLSEEKWLVLPHSGN